MITETNSSKIEDTKAKKGEELRQDSEEGNVTRGKEGRGYGMELERHHCWLSYVP